MARFSFQNYILDTAVPVLVRLRVGFTVFRGHFALQDPGLKGVSADIIQPVPLHQVFFHQFPVEEDDRHIVLAGHVDDRRGFCPIHQIDADHAAAVFDHFRNFVVLKALRPGGVLPHSHNIHAFCLARVHVSVEAVHQFREERIILVVQRDADPHRPVSPLPGIASAPCHQCCRKQHGKEQHSRSSHDHLVLFVRCAHFQHLPITGSMA